MRAAGRARKQRITAAVLSGALVLAFAGVAFAATDGTSNSIKTTHNVNTVTTTTPTTLVAPSDTDVTTTVVVGDTVVTTTTKPYVKPVKDPVDTNGDGVIDGRDGCDRNHDGRITDADDVYPTTPYRGDNDKGPSDNTNFNNNGSNHPSGGFNHGGRGPGRGGKGR